MADDTPGNPAADIVFSLGRSVGDAVGQLLGIQAPDTIGTPGTVPGQVPTNQARDPNRRPPRRPGGYQYPRNPAAAKRAARATLNPWIVGGGILIVAAAGYALIKDR